MIEENKEKPIVNQINIFLASYFKIIIFIIVLIIFVVSYFFLIYPKYKELTIVAETEISSSEKEYLELRDYLEKLKELKTEYGKIKKEDIKRIEAMLPREDNHEHLLSQIEKIVLKNGLLLTSIEFSEEEMKKKSTSRDPSIIDMPVEENSGLPKGVNQLKLKMKIVGTDYISLKKLLGAIENNLRLMDISKLSFDPKDNSVSLDLVTYYLKN